MRLQALIAVTLLLAPSASAGKLSPDFRRTFERTFTPKRTFAVVMQKGVPTTSIYGVKGDSTGAHYSIDVVDGRWKTSSGLFDFDQTMADWLELGEIMELDSIAYRDNRVDLRMVSREAHKVTRGSGFSQRTTPEPVATNFKFFLPYPQAQELTAAEVPAAVAAIGVFLRPFQELNAARQFSARLVAGGGRPPADERPRAGSSGTRPAASAKKELKVGMTALEVIEIMGKPQSEVSFQNQTKWTYSGVVVIFENGRVKEVRF